MKKVLVFGAGGFIGENVVSYHKSIGDYVCGVDLRLPLFSQSKADRFILSSIDEQMCLMLFKEEWDLVYQFAADMGGAGYVFSGEHDADVLSRNLRINLNILDAAKHGKQTLIFASSACVYPNENQIDPKNIKISEDSAFPANPSSGYGWEKLTAEKLLIAYNKNYGMRNKIVRLHNIYGIGNEFRGGKEKSLAAICRKVAESTSEVEIWGDGQQLRTYLYIDDLITAFKAIVDNDVSMVVNVGSEEMISINELAKLVIKISGKDLVIKNITGPVGVNARTSDNTLIRSLTKWEPKISLEQGTTKTYEWIERNIKEGL